MSNATELAKRLEAACSAFADYLDGLSPEQWRAVCGNHPTIRVGDEDEHRPVGLVAYHVTAALPRQVTLLRAIAAGEKPQPPQRASNEQQVADLPAPDQAETVALLRRNAGDATDAIRGLSEEELTRTGRTYLGELAAADVVERIFVGHLQWHEGSIRATLGS